YNCFYGRNIFPYPSGKLNVRAYGHIGGEGSALQHLGGGEDLDAVADSGYRFVLLEEMPGDVQYLFIQSGIFRRTASSHVQTIIIGRIYGIKINGDQKTVAGSLFVSLVSYKIMDGCR